MSALLRGAAPCPRTERERRATRIVRNGEPGKMTPGRCLPHQRLPAVGHVPVTALVADLQNPGLTAKPIDTMGLSKSFRSLAVFLDDLVLPMKSCWAKEGKAPRSSFVAPSGAIAEDVPGRFLGRHVSPTDRGMD